MRKLLLRLLFGARLAEYLSGYRPPAGEHTSLIVGNPTGWTWGKGDHGEELEGLDDDDHPHYHNDARHDLPARHPLGTVVPHDDLAALAEKSHTSLADINPGDHHDKYTAAEAETTVKANVEVGDLKTPTKALPMGSQEITDLAEPTASAGAATKGYVDDNLPAGPYTEGAHIYHNVGQTVAVGATFLAFNSERYDTDSIHDNSTNNSRLTCKTAGKYIVIAQVTFAMDPEGVRYCHLVRNGNTLVASAVFDPDRTGTMRMQCFTILDLAIDDYVQCQVFQSSSAVLDVLSSAECTPEFSMQRIG